MKIVLVLKQMGTSLLSLSEMRIPCLTFLRASLGMENNCDQIKLSGVKYGKMTCEE